MTGCFIVHLLLLVDSPVFGFDLAAQFEQETIDTIIMLIFCADFYPHFYSASMFTPSEMPIHCKPPLNGHFTKETICMKCHIQFSRTRAPPSGALYARGK